MKTLRQALLIFALCFTPILMAEADTSTTAPTTKRTDGGGREFGMRVGRLQYSLALMKQAYPEPPKQGDAGYARYSEIMDRSAAILERMRPELEMCNQLPESSHARQAFILYSLAVGIDLDTETGKQVAGVIREGYAGAIEAKVLRRRGDTDAWDNASIAKRQALSQEAYDAVKALLDAEQTALFELQYHPTDFLFTTQTVLLLASE